MHNYLVKIKVTVSDTEGTPKKKTEQYLVQDASPTAVEASMTLFFKDTTLEWELVSVSKTNIINIVIPDGKDKLTIL